MGQNSLYSLLLIEIDRLLAEEYLTGLRADGVRASDLKEMEEYAKKHNLKLR